MSVPEWLRGRPLYPGAPPQLPGDGPVDAIVHLLKRTGIETTDADMTEACESMGEGMDFSRRERLGPTRSTEEVLEDHLRCRMAGDVEADIERNYAPDVVLMTPKGSKVGHDAVRAFSRMLKEHVPPSYEIPKKLTRGRYAFIEWRAREPGRSVEDGADSFVIENGKIVFQSIHYTLQETMPG